MANSGGQPGNDNAHRGLEWKQSIKRALARSSGKTYREGLDKISKKFIDAANNGDAWALKELGDRIDGKAAQSIEIDADVKTRHSGTVTFVGKLNDESSD